MRKHFFTTSAAMLFTAFNNLYAQAADSTIKVTFGGFVDTYYAWDFNRPANFDRAFAGGTLYSTQPSRHNEFNVNLAFVEAKLEGPGVRGRIALQTGTSVQANYAGEPANGNVSGASIARLIQEAVVGARLAPNVWVDGGIFLSHLGMESWISRDNPTYGRSLVADYSPYYQSGVKLTWTPDRRLTAQLNVVNGWQNISENNRGKGAGVRVDFTPTRGTTLSYYNLVSQENGTRLRIFNGIGAKRSAGRFTLLGEFDLGHQDGDASGNVLSGTWYGYSAIARAAVTPAWSLVARVERFDDADQLVLATGAVDGAANPAFRANGFSIGADWQRGGRLQWRNEFRVAQNYEPIFARPATTRLTRTNAVAVSALTLTF